jgi:hypothetical protein
VLRRRGNVIERQKTRILRAPHEIFWHLYKSIMYILWTMSMNESVWNKNK